MGSSKKHKEKDKDKKKEHKKKHRRSRSRSRERRRKKEREAGVHPTEPAESRRNDERRVEIASVAIEIKKERDAVIVNSGDEPLSLSGDTSSLSIIETNKLRAKLGLKPLDVGEAPKNENEENTKTEDVHVPAVNIADVKRTEELREKMRLLKEKRKYTESLRKVKTLGDSDSEGDDVTTWIKKSRKLNADQLLAEKRAKLLQEMDEEFGVGNLVEEEFGAQIKKHYTARDLKGLKVEHGLERFKEGQTVILTLKDRGVLDEGNEETLVNVNLMDDEKADKNIENKKKKPEYKPYDEPQYDEYGMIKQKDLLSKYDEEIHGEKKTSFQLGSGGSYNAEAEKEMERIRQQLRTQGQALNMPSYNIASEYYTPEELQAKFKKVKKKVRKVRKKEILKADDLLPLADDETDFSSRERGQGKAVEKEEAELEKLYTEHYTKMGIKQEPMDTEDQEEPEVIGPDEDLTGVVVEEDEAALELDVALNRARKVGQKKSLFNPEKIALQMKSEPSKETEENDNDEKINSSIILNSTSEFCRNLGEIPTYGLAGNRNEDREELMDLELEQLEQKRRLQEQEEAASGWNEVDIENKPADIIGEEKAVLEEEPIVNQGMSAALQLAMKKGYLEKEDTKAPSAPKHSHLQAQNYSIEDKKYDDLDEKYRKRSDRYGSGGMIQDFKDKANYKPDIKLEYVDDSGRNLTEKEAFRQLSHRFHGKGSGKKKTEKRMKKMEEQQLMKQMSSTDTPLNTLTLLQEKQKSEKSPYIILSGNKGLASSITKTV